MTIHWQPGYGPGDSSAMQPMTPQQETMTRLGCWLPAIPSFEESCRRLLKRYKTAASGKLRSTSTKTSGQSVRRAAKVDANQSAITKALRSAGAFVQPLHTIGGGCPDLLVAYRGDWYLLEVKDGSKPPSQRRLTEDEEDWHAKAARHAPVFIAECADDALHAIGAIL